MLVVSIVFFFNYTSTTGIYPLSLHDALPISPDTERPGQRCPGAGGVRRRLRQPGGARAAAPVLADPVGPRRAAGRARGRTDRKSTRLNSSHANISYAVFCLKKKKDPVALLNQ